MKKKNSKSICALTIIMLFFSMIIPSSILGLGSSEYEWTDEFFDQSKIDADFSYDYVLSEGNVTIANTYPAWIAYPDWQRLKPITITNSGSQISNYVLSIDVSYDPDMQTDFDDLRFASETGSIIPYNIISRTIGSSAKVFVKLVTVPSGQSTIYMFYGNPSAVDGSSNLFTWTKVTGQDDIPISYTISEGCWDPDVAFGNNKFLSTWEEGIPPEYLEQQGHRVNHREVHGRLYNQNGGNPQPPREDGDILISTESALYHSENPTVAYGTASDKFFVAWEQNPTVTKWAVGIEGTLVRRSDGYVYTTFTICDPIYQFPQYYPNFDPCVAYDDNSDRFFVVWEASNTAWNFDAWGRLYTSGGSAIGTKFEVASGSGYQGQPWICSNNQGHYLVVYEEGPDPAIGPFSIKARLFDYTGTQIGSTKTIATGVSDIDNIFPSVAYNSNTDKYLVVWNTADVSNEDYNGKIYGRILDQNGDPQGSSITIQNGNVYKIADATTYLGSNFFVTYDNDDGIYGRIISSNGGIIEDRYYIPDSYSDGADFNNIAVSNGNIFSSWEDDRHLGAPPTAIYGAVWSCDQTFELSQISYQFGSEKSRILEAVVTSIPIEPELFQYWQEFNADFVLPSGTDIQFDILNSTTLDIIREDVSSGEDISDITDPSIRLKATLTRGSPENTPSLDVWTVIALVGGDLEPPWTEIELVPDEPNGDNGWYKTPINVTLFAYDNDTEPINVTTYYKINDQDIQEYQSPFEISTEKANNRLEYWSNDTAGNEELPHNVINDIKIDLTAPFVTILEPPDVVFPGTIKINGTATEYSSGSGIYSLEIKLNGEIVFSEIYDGIHTTWFDYEFEGTIGESYDVVVECRDMAGLIGYDAKQVTVTEYGLYQIGYLYLFENPKISIPLLERLGLAVAVSYDYIYLVVPNVHPDATKVEFVAKHFIIDKEVSDWDNNLSDGASINLELSLPIGMYEIKAYAYDSYNTLLEEYTLITKMIVLEL